MKVTLFRDMPTEGWLSMDRYADELTRALEQLGHRVRSVTVTPPWPHWRGRVRALMNYAWRYLVYPAAARTQQGDINHVLDHSYAHVLRVLEPKRTVVTCHDIAPLVFDASGRGISHRLWRYSFHSMVQAARIIAISASTRDEIARHCSYPAGRLPVIYFGVSSTFRDQVSTEVLTARRHKLGSGSRPLILHVGTCHPRKNVELILQALPALRSLGPMFVQVGGQFTPSQRQLIEHLDLRPHVQQLPPAAGQQLRAWYQAADVFAFPSLYEGFGLPVLEAMASGTPVVCANTTSLPEVAGDAALLVGPQEANALAEALRGVLTDSALRQRLIERGRARSREFTWERTARQTWEVYQAVCGG